MVYRTKTYIVVDTKSKEAFAVYATDQNEAVGKVIESYESQRMPPPKHEDMRTLEIIRIFDLTEEIKIVSTEDTSILYFHHGIPSWKVTKNKKKGGQE